MLVLVVQVLAGFECKAAFEKGFERLPVVAQYSKLASFGLLLIALALLLTAPAYHRIVDRNENTSDFALLLGRLLACALLPFALALGVDLSVVGQKLFGSAAGVVCGAVGASVAVLFWYGIELWQRGKQEGKHEMKFDDEGKPTPIKEKVDHVLTEARIVLPGAQALLGFQFVTFLMEGFEKLPRELQLLHFGALALVALCAILLMTPPAYHRLVEKGEDSEEFQNLASRFVCAAMIPLALGITGDLYVVARKVTESAAVSATFAAAALMMFVGLWFIFPMWRARTNR